MQRPRVFYRKWTSILLLLLLLYLYVIFSFFHIISLTSSETQPCTDCRAQHDAKLPSVVNNQTFTKKFSASSKMHQTFKKNTANEHFNATLNSTIEGDKFEKIDWNDYELMAKDAVREGPGEQGHAFIGGHTDDEQQIKQKLFEKYNFNAFASDRISFGRSIGDLRTEGCKRQYFLKDIPADSVDVVIVFHNERNSTLLRTIHGIVNRSPASLIRQIILVDDLSTAEELKAQLHNYVTLHFPKVKIIRNQERMGLIKSRMIGAAATNGKFLVFLDAHVEVNYNYLPPLLEPMVLDYKTVVCPMVDFINADTLRVDGGPRRRGAFDWDLTYKRLPVTEEMDETTPHPSPVMVGCAFAISRQWWDELGQYDPGLEIWGAEQYELSFKSWQCGGSLVDAPCSRVAHLFRPLPYVKEVVEDDLIEKNYMRIATVWLDEYKEYVLKRRPKMNEVNPGNLTAQIELRKRLNCKPFKWFMEVVAPDIPKYYPLILPEVTGYGKIRSRYDDSMCVVAIENDRGYALGSCETAPDFDHDWRQHIRLKWTKCMANPDGKSVFPWECIDIESRPTQNFVWNIKDGHIVSVCTKRCLDASSSSELQMHHCNSSNPMQAWDFEGYNATLAMERWEQYISEVKI